MEPESEEEVLGMLGSLLTTVRPEPLGTVGSPVALMGMVTVPAPLLVTTTTWPAVFWKVAWAPVPVRTAAVGCPLLPVTNWTEDEVVAAAPNAQQVSNTVKASSFLTTPSVKAPAMRVHCVGVFCVGKAQQFDAGTLQCAAVPNHADALPGQSNTRTQIVHDSSIGLHCKVSEQACII